MPLIQVKCKNCGANLNFDESKNTTICTFCNTPYIYEKAINNVTNTINAENVTIINSSGNDLQHELDKVDGYISLDNYNSAFQVIKKLCKEYPGNFDVWKKYLDLSFDSVNKNTGNNVLFEEVLFGVRKTCPENKKKAIEEEIDNKFDFICKKIQDGKMSITILNTSYFNDVSYINIHKESFSDASSYFFNFLNILESFCPAVMNMVESGKKLTDKIQNDPDFGLVYDYQLKSFCKKDYKPELDLLYLFGNEVYVYDSSDKHIHYCKLSYNCSFEDYNSYSNVLDESIEYSKRKLYETGLTLKKSRIEKNILLAIDFFEGADHYKDSDLLIEQCKAKIENIKKEEERKKLKEETLVKAAEEQKKAENISRKRTIISRIIKWGIVCFIAIIAIIIFIKLFTLTKETMALGNLRNNNWIRTSTIFELVDVNNTSVDELLEKNISQYEEFENFRNLINFKRKFSSDQEIIDQYKNKTVNIKYDDIIFDDAYSLEEALSNYYADLQLNRLSETDNAKFTEICGEMDGILSAITKYETENGRDVIEPIGNIVFASKVIDRKNLDPEYVSNISGEYHSNGSIKISFDYKNGNKTEKYTSWFFNDRYDRVSNIAKGLNNQSYLDTIHDIKILANDANYSKFYTIVR